MINYLGKFLPNLSKETEPLRESEKKTVEWHWNEAHEEAVKKIKNLISKSPVLKYYSPKEEITSRALTECEQRYVWIQKEASTIAFS